MISLRVVALFFVLPCLVVRAGAETAAVDEKDPRAAYRKRHLLSPSEVAQNHLEDLGNSATAATFVRRRKMKGKRESGGGTEPAIDADFEAIDAAIDAIADKKDRKTLENQLKKVIKEYNKDPPASEKLDKTISKFAKDTTKLFAKGDITEQQFNDIKNAFEAAFGAVPLEMQFGDTYVAIEKVGEKKDRKELKEALEEVIKEMSEDPESSDAQAAIQKFQTTLGDLLKDGDISQTLYNNISTSSESVVNPYTFVDAYWETAPPGFCNDANGDFYSYNGGQVADVSACGQACYDTYWEDYRFLGFDYDVDNSLCFCLFTGRLPTAMAPFDGSLADFGLDDSFTDSGTGPITQIAEIPGFKCYPAKNAFHPTDPFSTITTTTTVSTPFPVLQLIGSFVSFDPCLFDVHII